MTGIPKKQKQTNKKNHICMPKLELCMLKIVK